MEPYLFQGVVLPERAQLSLGFDLHLTYLDSGITCEARVSIVLNQVAVWVKTEQNLDIFDLRNTVKSFVQSHLAMIGYLKGLAYDFEVTRVLSKERGIDYVFGIEVPCIAERNQASNLNEALSQLRIKANGENGVFLHRCFNDLVSAMKNAEDTGFYCYRAIESLRHHCASLNGLKEASKAQQWHKLRAISGIPEESIRTLKLAADPLRHGESVGITSAGRAELFNTTWSVVDAYLNALPPAQGHRAETSD